MGLKLARVDEFIFQYHGFEDEMWGRLHDKYINKLSAEQIEAKYGKRKKKRKPRSARSGPARLRAAAAWLDPEPALACCWIAFCRYLVKAIKTRRP